MATTTATALATPPLCLIFRERMVGILGYSPDISEDYYHGTGSALAGIPA